VLTFERYYSQRENIVKKLSSLILLSAMSVAPAAFSAPVGTLSVHILNQQTGLPSSGVTVTLENSRRINGQRWPPASPTTMVVLNRSIQLKGYAAGDL
jgi:hypothetical protein